MSKAQPVEKVTLTRAEYEALLAFRERLSELEDRLEGKRAIEGFREEPTAYLPAASVKRLIAGENPVRIWRERRGFKANELARKVGITSAYLSEIETNKKPGSIDALRKIARALGVLVDDLLPG